MTIPGYDAWKLAGPDDDRHEVGNEDGETCGRVEPPDEDAPRGYRPRPCTGVMEGVDGFNVCDTCGEIGE